MGIKFNEKCAAIVCEAYMRDGGFGKKLVSEEDFTDNGLMSAEYKGYIKVIRECHDLIFTGAKNDNGEAMRKEAASLVNALLGEVGHVTENSADIIQLAASAVRGVGVYDEKSSRSRFRRAFERVVFRAVCGVSFADEEGLALFKAEKRLEKLVNRKETLPEDIKKIEAVLALFGDEPDDSVAAKLRDLSEQLASKRAALQKIEDEMADYVKAKSEALAALESKIGAGAGSLAEKVQAVRHSATSATEGRVEAVKIVKAHIDEAKARAKK